MSKSISSSAKPARTPSPQPTTTFSKAATAAYRFRRPSAIETPQVRWAIGGAVLALALVLGVVELTEGRRAEPAPAAAVVALAAFRGGDSGAFFDGPARRPLELTIDAPDLPAAAGYRVEVVGATGREAWSGAATAPMSPSIAKGLPPGIYWVRLYAPHGEWLREFGLRLR